MSITKIIFLAVWVAAFSASGYALLRLNDLRLAPSTAPVVAKLNDKSGDVQARGDEMLNWAHLGKGDELHDGDTIATGEGATAKLKFPDGRTLELGGATLLELRASNTGNGREYLVSLLKGLVVSNSAHQSAGGVPGAKKTKIRLVTGNKEYRLDDRKADVAIKTASRTRGAEVLFASKALEVRAVKMPGVAAAPATKLPPVTGKTGSLAELNLAGTAPKAGPVMALAARTAAVSAPRLDLGSDEGPRPEEGSPDGEGSKESLPVAPPPAKPAPKKTEPPAPKVAVKPPTVVFPAGGSTLWLVDGVASGPGKTMIPVRIAPAKGAPASTRYFAELTRKGSDGAGRSRKILFTPGNTTAEIAATELLANVRAGSAQFAVRGGIFTRIEGNASALRDGQGENFVLRGLGEFGESAVNVEVGSLSEASLSGQRWILQKGLSGEARSSIRLSSAADLGKLLPLLNGTAGFKIAKAGASAEDVTFLVRGGAIVAELPKAVAADELKFWCTRLGADLAFRGHRNALVSTALGEAKMTSVLQSAMKGKRETFIVVGDELVPLNWDFFKQFREVQSYVRAKSPLVFTEQVEIIK